MGRIPARSSRRFGVGPVPQLSIAAVLLALIAFRAHAQESRYIVYFGTSAGPESKGIYTCSFEPTGVRLGPVSLVAEIERATWITAHPNGKSLYAVSELGNDGKTDGEILSFGIHHANGALRLLNRGTSGGGGPTHLAVDKQGKAIAVANFGGGRVTAFRLNADGSLGQRSALVQHAGSSVHPQRQTGPHPHAVVFSPDGRFLFVSDLGTDKVYSYRYDASSGSLTPNDPAFVQVPAGSGPRHFAFHPRGRFAYLLQQMESRISAYAYDAPKGSLSEVQMVSTLPDGFRGVSSGAEIAVGQSGRFLYASNRGDDSIAVFAIEPSRGTLKMIQRVPTQGKVPRNFAIDPTGRFLFAANQDSGTVVVFQIDAKTGELSPTGKGLNVPTPVCIVFVPAGVR